MRSYQITIPSSCAGMRIDKAIAELSAGVSRSLAQKAIASSHVAVNSVIITNQHIKVKGNDVVSVSIIETIPDNLAPTNIPLKIIFEDEDLLVINKDAGMTVHPASGYHQDTMVNALLYHTKNLSDVGGEFRPGIVHRLDKDTSGLMIVAKNNLSHANLAKQIAERSFVRKYKALVWGVIKPLNGTIDLPIARSRLDRTKMTVVKSGGKQAITHYTTIEVFCGGKFSLVECKLQTGRTHQIRAHLSHIGHSIVGDQIYGHNSRKVETCANDELRLLLSSFERQALHSYYIRFIHPTKQVLLEFSTPLSADYEEIVALLRKIG